jgi:hypothetical protein
VERRTRRDYGMHLTDVDMGAGPADRVVSKQSSEMTAEIEKALDGRTDSCNFIKRVIIKKAMQSNSTPMPRSGARTRTAMRSNGSTLHKPAIFEQTCTAFRHPPRCYTWKES